MNERQMKNYNEKLNFSKITNLLKEFVLSGSNLENKQKHRNTGVINSNNIV